MYLLDLLIGRYRRFIYCITQNFGVKIFLQILRICRNREIFKHINFYFVQYYLAPVNRTVLHLFLDPKCLDSHQEPIKWAPNTRDCSSWLWACPYTLLIREKFFRENAIFGKSRIIYTTKILYCTVYLLKTCRSL